MDPDVGVQVNDAIRALGEAEVDLRDLVAIQLRLSDAAGELSRLAAQLAASIPDSQDGLVAAWQGIREAQMSFNLQYLQLQNQMQNENRQFTMVSNILKTKHDTVKNTIANIR